MENNSVVVDAYIVQVVSWILVLLFSSIIAILTWVSKTVVKKVDTIADKQDLCQLEITSIKNHFTALNGDVNDVYERLKDLPTLIQKSASIEESLKSVKEDMSSIKQGHNDHAKRISDLEKVSAKNSEWIRMTDEYNKRKSQN